MFEFVVLLAVNWVNFDNIAFRNFLGVSKGPGIYFLRWKKYENPVVIARLGGSDELGLLYIGESKNLKRRLQRLWKAIKNVKDVEADLRRVDTLRNAILFCNLHNEIGSGEYEIAWEGLSTKLEAQIQQAVALQLYTLKFKEPPPLNLKVCGSTYLKWGIYHSDSENWSGKANNFVKSILS